MSEHPPGALRVWALIAVAAIPVLMISITARSQAAPDYAGRTTQATKRSRCDGIAKLRIPKTTVTSAVAVAAGTYQPPGSTQGYSNLPAFCRITAVVSSVRGSTIGIEIWLPVTEWNHRYMQVGTHGTGGAIDWDEMAPELRRGFATASTDGGHVSTIPYDTSWGIGSRVRVVDYAWRSVHQLAVQGKRIITAYYHQAPKFSYYAGSSTGGRDGLKSAQKFPHDFDGILAGSAIQNFTRGATQMLAMSQRLAAAGFSGEQGSALLGLVQRSAIAACDSDDGVSDGIITDPRTCRWDPHSMLCAPEQDPSTCLTLAQADAVAASIAPLTDPKTHKKLFVGQTASSELDWISFILTPTYARSVYELGLSDPSWDSSTFDLHRDYAAIEKSLGVINATDPDLSAFEAAGGKIIQYQPWEDGVAYAQAAVDYYESVRRTTSGGDRHQQQSFYRLFMMPGVAHTGAGTGPYSFGQDAFAPRSTDPRYDAVSALETWVEQGIAPTSFVATKYVNNDPAQGVALQRLLCLYPSEAVYNGTGDTNAPSSYSCKVPPNSKSRKG